jgi:hypothetical protein
MGNSNAYKHLTLEERRIIQTGISNGSTKPPLEKLLARTTRRSVRRSKTTGSLRLNAVFLWNVMPTKNVSMAGSVSPDAPITSLVSAAEGTGLPERAMAARTGAGAVLINSGTALNTQIRITALFLLIHVWE